VGGVLNADQQSSSLPAKMQVRLVKFMVLPAAGEAGVVDTAVGQVGEVEWPAGVDEPAHAVGGDFVCGLHDRMPVILDQQDWPPWLGEIEGDGAALLRTVPDGLLRVWPVDRRIRLPRNNGPELLEAITA
jgi:hypothetical protein